ncbi:hypothetical protein [Ilumatobacter nonamiensis]|uniref:hypothetical protein n=1 Tax=Ilumatobacter nonamiensis TaxID=467093 RepID=UPI00034B2123|nr:hypothetical protein [Ilumatobacter nonamiensis]
MTHDDGDDTELRGIAMGAVHEHEVSVTNAETESALGSVRSLISAGDTGDDITSTTLTPRRDRRSPWLLVGAAAGVIALIAGGLVTVLGGDASDTIVPATDPPEAAVSAAPTSAAPTVPETTVAPETTSTPAPTTVPAPPFEQQTIRVDAANPPSVIDPEVFARVPIELNPDGALDSSASVAIGPDNIVVHQKGTDAMSVIGPQGEVRRIPIEEQISSIVSGPGGVVYGLGDAAFDDGSDAAPTGLRFVAIPFVGEQAGEVIAVEEVPWNEYLELPPFFFGHGSDGVIDRGRQVGDTVIEYVDETGAPLEPVDEFPLPAFGDPDDDGFREDASVIELVDSNVSWKLDITRDPTNATPFVGRTYPAPTTDGRVVYFERIGADLTPDQDFGPNSLPVVAILNPDGSGTWVGLPQDWDVVASDVWGTVLMRRTDTDLEFAFLDDALTQAGETPTSTTAPPTTVAEQDDDAIAIERTCVSEFDCTELANTEDGRIVAYDPTVPAFRVYDSAGNDLQSEVPIGPDVIPADGGNLLTVGPDDVAYVRITTPGAQDPSNDLLAIPLVGDDAGQVVMSWTGLDGTGDSTLIPRRAGLTVVPCCGPRETRPSLDAPIYRWVDRSGGVIESEAPSFDLNLGDEGNSLTRIDGESTFTRFALPTVFQYPRDFPQIVATDDGGALATDVAQLRSGAARVFVKFGPDWPDNGNVYFQAIDGPSTVSLLEPSGTIVVADGDSFVRRTLDEIATAGWSGKIETDRDGAILAPGLNDDVAERQPYWAGDPGLFALQLKSTVGANERVTIEYDDAPAPVIRVTTEGFLDDSVAASQLAITTEVGDDGLLRFVSGTTTYRCQPGRGHQDFSAELCI